VSLEGIDVSRWNAVPSQAMLAPLEFAFAKASQAYWRDPRYSDHVAAFRRAGLIVGAYHFGVGSSQSFVAQQVRTFLAAAAGADLLALDLERNGNGPTMSQAEAREFIRLVKASGRSIGLYHSRSGFPSLGQSWNWVAQWGSRPPDIAWAFWQYQGSPLDRNRAAGTLADLRRLAGLRLPEPVSTADPGEWRAGVSAYPGGLPRPFWLYRWATDPRTGERTWTRERRWTRGFSAPVTVSWGSVLGARRRMARLDSGALRGFWLDVTSATRQTNPWLRQVGVAGAAQ